MKCSNEFDAREGREGQGCPYKVLFTQGGRPFASSKHATSPFMAARYKTSSLGFYVNIDDAAPSRGRRSDFADTSNCRERQDDDAISNHHESAMIRTIREWPCVAEAICRGHLQLQLCDLLRSRQPAERPVVSIWHGGDICGSEDPNDAKGDQEPKPWPKLQVETRAQFPF
jgi:hypothetical protein